MDDKKVAGTTLALRASETSSSNSSQKDLVPETFSQGEGDNALGRRLLRKLDCVILPLLSLSYLLAYIDRNNIGNARLMGLQKTLHLSNGQYYNAVMVFFGGYLATIFAANLFIRKLGPNVQLGSAVLLFGLFISCMCKARGYADIIGLRFGIGAAEALLQASPLYMSAWYGRHELGKRIAIFYSAVTLSGVFSGFIAYGVQKDLSNLGRPAWQWLFIIEGSIAIASGLLIICILPGFPDKIKKAWFLSEAEVQLAVHRTRDSNQAGAKFNLQQVKASLLDPKTWLLAVLSACNSTLLASVGAFLPTIVQSFGFTSVQAQLFTVIPYSCAFVCMIVVGLLSDRYKNKGYFIIGALTLCIVGLVVLIATTSKVAGIIGACLLLAGAYPSAVLQIAWVQITFCGYTKRAVSWGVAMIFGQGVSMAGAHLYTSPPHFYLGHGTLMGLSAVGIISTILVQIIMRKSNGKKEEELVKYNSRGEEHPHARKSLEETCDDHVNVRYIL